MSPRSSPLHLSNCVSMLALDMQERKLSSDRPPQEWLQAEVNQKRESLSSVPHIPMKGDGSEFDIDDLCDDQKWIAYVILEKIKEYFTCTDFTKFEPLRMTINGQGGTGKSVLLNTITSVVRKFTGCNDSVLVCAPTGTAAFNVNGETVHSMVRMSCNDDEHAVPVIGESTRTHLAAKLKDALVLIADERSMMSCSLLGKAEHIINETAFEGLGSAIPATWGGIPVVLIAGDDYQLQGMGECAPDTLPQFVRPTSDKNILNGRNLFKEFGSIVHKLPKVRRMDESKVRDMQLLDRVRVGENVPDDDVQRLQNLHIDVIERKHGKAALAAIKKNAIYLFFKNVKRSEHNLLHLSQLNTEDNPTAILKTKSSSSKYVKGVRGHFKNKSAPSSLLCIGAKVCLRDRNFFPLWGLHNGACGTVQEIVFEESKSPIHGDLPSYVIVEFPLCRGPAWDINNPKHVPIPMCSSACKYKCCERTYCPLDLCFARTIHKFQGLEAGPPVDGVQKHMCHSVIVDPDEKDIESTHTGLFYTAVSRGTTLGDPDGLNSAVYFCGCHLNAERIQQLTMCKNGLHECIKVTKRREWVKFLERNTQICGNPNSARVRTCFDFFGAQIECDVLHSRRCLCTSSS